ncbi:MAG: hypothetical protein ACU84J_07230, partial [Gammaproteobacteria bacterium]
PTIKPVAAVELGTPVSIIVTNSETGVLYRLYRQALPVSDAVAGNGGELTLKTGAVDRNTVLVLRSEHTSTGSMKVELERAIPVPIQDAVA